MIAHSNQSCHIVEWHDRKFVAQMEYTNVVFVERIPQPVIVPELIAPIFPIQLTYPTLGEPDPRPEN